MVTEPQSVSPMNVKLIFPTQDVAKDYYKQIVFLACKLCYSESNPEEIWEKLQSGKITDRKIESLINKVVASGHHSTIEHIVFTFAISGVSRTLTHQLVRHRIGVAFDQQSQRYVSLSNPVFVEPPTIADNNEAHQLYQQAQQQMAEVYEQLLQLGIPSEDARFVFPQGVGSNLIMTVNLRELIHICGLRLCSLAQWEIRAMFQKVRAEVKQVSPYISRMLVPHCVHEGFCSELGNKDGHCRIRPHMDQVQEIYTRWKNGELVDAPEPDTSGQDE